MAFKWKKTETEDQTDIHRRNEVRRDARLDAHDDRRDEREHDEFRTDADGVIRFSRADLEYGFLSNLHPEPFEYGGRSYLSAEHCFQAQKFAGTEYEQKICIQDNPVLARELAMRPEQEPRKDWDEVKEDAMRDSLRAKFRANGELRRRLLATGDTPLVDHEGDKYWGDNGDGTGRNRMGIILMEVRDELRQEFPNDSPQPAPTDREREESR